MMIMGGDAFLRKASAFARYLCSRRAISVYKGTIAYIVGFTLMFLRKFDDLSHYPASFTSMTILLIVGGAGKSMGSCVMSLALALTGVGLGAVGFVILAHLSGSQVAQGFVFAAIVYAFGLVKAKGLKWFSLALIGILLSFSGLYTSFLAGGFSSVYLEEYIKTYCWGGAVVLAVNMLVLPISSEKELRQTLILSLEHIATFTHLLAKGYTLEITEEEKIIRDHLVQTIRADFGLLSQKIDDTFIEINYSRFSTKDYQCFVTRIRRMQQALITAYSSLVVEKKDMELFKNKFLPSTLKNFNRLRGALHMSMRDIYSELGCTALVMPASSAGYAEFMDIERQESTGSLSLRQKQHGSSVSFDSVDERLASVSRRLEEEVGEDHDTDSPTMVRVGLDIHEERRDARTGVPIPLVLTRSAASATAAPSETGMDEEHDELEPEILAPSRPKIPRAPTPPKSPAFPEKQCNRSPGFCVRSLRRIFDRFRSDQHDILVECLSEGKLHGADDSLRLLEPLPSLKDIYQYRYVPSTADGSRTARPTRRRRNWMDDGTESGCATPMTPRSSSEKRENVYYEMIREKTMLERISDEVTTASHHGLMRVYSFMFAMEQFVTEVETLYHSTKRDPKRRLRIHYFPRLNVPGQGFPPAGLAPSSPSTNPPGAPVSASSTNMDADPESLSYREISVAEALSLLEHRTYRKKSPSLLQRVSAAEQWLRSPTSVYAAKTAVAASVFAVLLLHPVPRPWFVSFTMSGGALTIVTALQPTLGQSVLSFILQILGQGLGYVWALIILEIFRNVGGYHYNPYGIVAFLVPYALALQYILYHKPQYFVAALLGLNGTGTVLLAEWINVEYLGNTSYDTPVLRFAKAFTTLGVALGIVGIFQLFILRNPSRRSLRKRIGAMIFAQLSYLTLLQAFVRGSMPPDPSKRAPEAAIVRVAEELRHRELKIQAELIALRPLVGYAAAEAQFSRPFPEGIFNKILRTSQIMLDRMRESFIAISSEPLPDVVLKNYVQVLAPYRRRNVQVQQLAYYLVASSLLGKAPLLRETPAELESAGHTTNFMHDMLVLAGRHARTEEGARTIRSGSFTRYFHYLVGVTSLNEHLKTLEDACKDLFGELEDHLA